MPKGFELISGDPSFITFQKQALKELGYRRDIDPEILQAATSLRKKLESLQINSGKIAGVTFSSDPQGKKITIVHINNKSNIIVPGHHGVLDISNTLNIPTVEPGFSGDDVRRALEK